MPLGERSPRARTRKRPACYHHGDLRAAAVRAATRAVARRGLDALTMREVAGELGVSPPALHHHFANKTELVAAAAGAAFALLDGALEAAEEEAGDDAALVLEELGAAYVRFAVEHPGAFRLVFGGHVRALELDAFPEVAAPGRATRRRLERAVAAAYGLPEGGRDVASRVAILWGQVVGLSSLFVERELGPALHVEEAVALCREAVRSHLRGLRREARRGGRAER